MYCYQCGAEIAEHFKFCSKCGRSLEAPARRPNHMATHLHILAWLFIGTAVLYGFVGMVLTVIPAIVQHLPIPAQNMPLHVLPFVLFIIRLAGLAVIVVSAGTAAAGVGLLQYQSWGRPVALIMAALMLLKFPVGTAVGIYAFWVLLSAQGREYYESQSALAAR